MSLGRAIETALAEAAGRTGSSPLVAVSLPVALDPEAVYAGASRAGTAVFFWDSRTAENVERELFACVGVARTFEAAGPTRFGALRAAAREVFLELPGLGRERAAGVRIVGGLTFADAPAEDAAWPVPGGRFVLPRATVTSRPGEGTTLTVIASRAELAVPARLAREVERDLTAPVIEESASKKRRTSCRVVDDGSAAFVENVRDALAAIASGSLEKVVLARRSRVVGAPRADVVLRALGAAEGAVRFAVTAGASTFLGASPELLASVHGGVARTEALAGSEPRAGFELAEVQRLLLRDKDRREHAIVVDAIASALDGLARGVVVGETRVRTVPSIHHLVTPFSATLPADAGVLDLVERLHPTPALGGAPRETALAFVGEREQRGPYAGPVGWLGPDGEGAFVVGIRSALLGPEHAWVYAGAGVVSGSVPALELAETRAKETGMLRAMGALAGVSRRSGSEASA